MTAVLIGLAAYRVWRMFARDSIFEPLRAKVITRSDHPVCGWIWDLIDCPWCLGFHLSWALAAGWALLTDAGWWDFGITALAASTVCGIVGHWTQD